MSLTICDLRVETVADLATGSSHFAEWCGISLEWRAVSLGAPLCKEADQPVEEREPGHTRGDSQEPFAFALALGLPIEPTTKLLPEACIIVGINCHAHLVNREHFALFWLRQLYAAFVSLRLRIVFGSSAGPLFKSEIL